MKNTIIAVIAHRSHQVFRAVEVFHTCHFIYHNADTAIRWLNQYLT